MQFDREAGKGDHERTKPARRKRLDGANVAPHTAARYVAHVLPLTSGARRKAGVSYSATAAMFIRKAVLDLPSPPEAVATQFNLTPAEVRVLFSIVKIGGVPEVAPVLGISEQTVKSHLHRIYEKTTTKRRKRCCDRTFLSGGGAASVTACFGSYYR